LIVGSSRRSDRRRSASIGRWTSPLRSRGTAGRLVQLHRLPAAKLPFDFCEERCRIEDPAIRHDHLGMADVTDGSRGIAADDDQVGFFAFRNAAGSALDAERAGAVEGGDLNRLELADSEFLAPNARKSRGALND
jgi:hypothetical protein